MEDEDNDNGIPYYPNQLINLNQHGFYHHQMSEGLQPDKQGINEKSLFCYLYLNQTERNNSLDIGFGIADALGLKSLLINSKYCIDERQMRELKKSPYEIKMSLIPQFKNIEVFQTKANEQESYLFNNLESLNLNLSQQFIQEKGYSNILDGIQRCPNLTSLNINFRDQFFTEESIKEFCETLHKLSHLNQLKVQISKIHDEQIQETIATLGQGIAQCQNLNSLHLDLSHCQLLDQGLSSLIENISPLKGLQEFSLIFNDNQIKQEGFLAVLKLLQEFKKLSTLELIFNNNQIPNSCLTQLSNSIKNLTSLNNLSLQINNNYFDGQGALEVFNSIYTHQGIRCLSLQIGQFQNLEDQLLQIQRKARKIRRLVELILDLSEVQ